MTRRVSAETENERLRIDLQELQSSSHTVIENLKKALDDLRF